MSKTLAIKGRETQGIEVIKLLEMMGGKNCFHLHGLFSEHAYYFIGGPRNDEIRAGEYIFNEDDMCFFTLEEFWAKFPFKVGDRVHIPEYESEVRICQMKWDPLCEYMEYMVYRNDDEEWYTTEELLQWNDNPNNTSKRMEEKKINQMSLANCDLDEVEIVLGDKFELKIEDGKYYAVRKKSKYPTTYEECWKVRFEVEGETTIEEFHNVSGYYSEALSALQKLFCCRDAYWKIAGEEMGLDGPWKPDYTDLNSITYYGLFNELKYSIINPSQFIFPTVEMRDAFYKNFKYLIEICK